MKNILVPIGSTESAQKTLQYAIDFASEINAKVFVFRAYSSQTKAGTMINVDAIIERETSLYLRTMVSACDIKNVEIKLISAKGSVVDSVKAIDQELGIDLVIVGTKSNSIKEGLFLGRTAGKLVKQADIAILAVPEGYKFQPISSVLMAFKSGIVKSKTAVKPLNFIIDKFKAEVNLLLVKTPKYKEDMLCVFTRKRGFFKKLWEKNTILKEEFYSNVPLLVLKGKS